MWEDEFIFLFLSFIVLHKYFTIFLGNLCKFDAETLESILIGYFNIILFETIFENFSIASLRALTSCLRINDKRRWANS